jgi:cytoskeleton protein RodZ
VLVQSSTVGVGPALRKARLARGVSIDEAARDTRIRPEFLHALEQEEYERLLGDVYVRGCLRSYAAYLGLSPDKAVELYAQHVAEPSPMTSVQLAKPSSVPAMGAPRRRDNHRLIGMIAAVVLVLAAAFGLLSARNSTPEPANLPSNTPPESAQTTGIVVAVLALQQVEITVQSDDGATLSYKLQPGEGRSFAADVKVEVDLSHGASAQITVNGVDQGFPGRAGKPWHKTYSFEEGESSSPSP